ncbi:MAG: ABC transporter substrate-binding protein [Burkholderiales bacterium]|nr:ABC transporter substrate-binding protein [Burkholderiales bacterium]
MKAIALLVIIVLAGLFAPLTPAAPLPGKVPRIGYLVLSPLISPPSPERAAFLDGLRELGYEDGKNIIIEYRSAEGDAEVLPFLAAELIEAKVDLIVTLGAQTALVLKNATRTIPIVFLFATDPVGTGLVKSLAHPGGNVTGMSVLAYELGAKRLQLLKETLPGLSRVAILRDSNDPAAATEWKATQAAARALHISLQPLDIQSAQDLSAAFAIIRKQPPDALIALMSSRIYSYRNIINKFAMSQHLPIMSGFREFTLAGALMSYSPSLPYLTRRAAVYVDKILKGAKPGDLPVEQPTEIELVINLKTAKALGIKIPPALLLRADEVIQ